MEKGESRGGGVIMAESKPATDQEVQHADRRERGEAVRERRQRLLAMLARAVSLADVEQAVRRLRPRVFRAK
jgi:hypothetical protein